MQASSGRSSTTGLSPVLFTPDQIDSQVRHPCLLFCNCFYQVAALAPAAQKISQTNRKRTFMLPKFQSESLSSYQQLFAILENEKGSHIDIDGSLSQSFLDPCPIQAKA